jgi:aldose 1-epimerase
MLELSAGPSTATIDLAAGGRLSSLRIDGLELLEQRTTDNHPFGWGSYPMVPWAGRIRNGTFSFDGHEVNMSANMGPHAIHGTCFDAAWEHLTGGDDWAMLGRRLDGQWPFGGSVTQLIHLGASSLTQTITVVAGDRDMPAVVGWHPWFRRHLERGDALRLVFDTDRARRWDRDSDFIPSGVVGPAGLPPWDDCFDGVETVGLEWPGAVRVDVTHDCDYVVIYDPPHAMCVEPQSGRPDEFNLDPDACRVEAGDVVERTVTWRWTMASRPV